MAHPELLPRDGPLLFQRPDDPVPSTSIPWRRRLAEYNHGGGNPERLLDAAHLYSPGIYQDLLGHVGKESFFILSAGWGLVRSSFLLPDYDITFSSQAEPPKRRNERDVFCDFNHLDEAEVSTQDTIYFFGGKDYLSLYYRLAHHLSGRKVIYFAARSIPQHGAFEYLQYGGRGTNWHYRCARDFVDGRVPR